MPVVVTVEVIARVVKTAVVVDAWQAVEVRVEVTVVVTSTFGTQVLTVWDWVAVKVLMPKMSMRRPQVTAEG